MSAPVVAMVLALLLIALGAVAAVRQVAVSRPGGSDADQSAQAPVHWTRSGRSEIGAPAPRREARTPDAARFARTASTPGATRRVR